MTLNDLFPPDEQGVENKIDVERAMGRLSRREAAVLYLWVTGYSQAEIGRMFGYTDRHIRRILANISEKCPKSSEKLDVNYRD
jgi:DNA-directed RNA polymerase specialized sigma24 family protein